ncbi:MAG: hypothetical protein CFH33_01476 [Alphaproteobacteria bacterium MarineAlpha9_Bin3]|nr:MAG: hypothetical protein CFH33_01476 [Alphaproteobacteria bacterium MarineAlpha9_Bin3]|tara:strand:- start:4640 stop:5155 length:516 start_codon:yes stop_codon:yes gene_type:complete
MTDANISPEGVPAPKLEYIMTYQADLLPAQNINRDKVVWDAATTGGWVKDIWGNKGKLIPPSGDWMTVLPNGTLYQDVRATILMEDGALLFVEYKGKVKWKSHVPEKIETGKPITWEDHEYFINSPTITTESKKYEWMNDVIFINKVVEVQLNNDKKMYVRYDTYQVVMHP